MREDSRDYGAISAGGTMTTLHWHDGRTCHGSPTLKICQDDAISNGWVGRVLEVEDTYRDGAKVKCYSMIAGSFDHHVKRGRYVVEVKLVAVPIP